MSPPYAALVVMAVCAITFYRVGRQERSWGLLWASLSIAISVLALNFLNWGLLGVLAGQLILFVGITLYRMSDR